MITGAEYLETRAATGREWSPILEQFRYNPKMVSDTKTFYSMQLQNELKHCNRIAKRHLHVFFVLGAKI